MLSDNYVLLLGWTVIVLLFMMLGVVLIGVLRGMNQRKRCELGEHERCRLMPMGGFDLVPKVLTCKHCGDSERVPRNCLYVDEDEWK